tara:strand:- start:3714 stop:4451 length:738 start_codon:yes stop_codon:yes gene_type:complete
MKFKKDRNSKHYSKIYFIIIFFLIISLTLNHGIFRKFYNILISDHDHRINKIYGYCGEESIGFIKMLKKKYKFKTNPKIINFKHNPSSLWAIYNNKIKKNNGSNIIFLNYSSEFRLKFNKSGNTYRAINRYEHTNEISKIIFNIENKFIKLNNNILIYTLNSKGEKNIIFKEKIYNEFNKENITYLNFKTKNFNSEKYPIYIEIENLENDVLNKISSIDLILKNKYNINNFKIIEKKDNCYYVIN